MSRTLGIPKEELLKRMLNIADEKKEESKEGKAKKRSWLNTNQQMWCIFNTIKI